MVGFERSNDHHITIIDSLIKNLQELNRNEFIFKSLIVYMKYVLRAFIDLNVSFKGNARRGRHRG